MNGGMMKLQPSRSDATHSDVRSRVVRRVAGFTLIELMIVIAVVATLAAIALPSYNESVRKGRRGQAKADLVEYAQLLERFHTVKNTYDMAGDTPIEQSPQKGKAFYTIAISDVDANKYTLTATPVADTNQAGDKCGALSIDQAGAKQPTTEKCW